MAYTLRIDDILVPLDIAKPIVIFVSLLNEVAEIIARGEISFDNEITLAEAKIVVREWANPYVKRQNQQVAALGLVGQEFPFEE